MANHVNTSNQNDCKNHSNKTKLYSSVCLSQTDEYIVYWYDPQHSCPLSYYKISPSKLRAIIDYLQCSTSINVCVEYIRNLNNQLVFVIVSSSPSLQLLEQIHDLPQVHSIYIYQDNIFDTNLFNMYSSIKTIDQLIFQQEAFLSHNMISSSTKCTIKLHFYFIQKNNHSIQTCLLDWKKMQCIF